MLADAVISGFVIRVIYAALILLGAALFLFFYHVRTRHFDASERRRVTNFGAYEWIDWYLKLSTLGLTVSCLFVDHPALAKWHHDAGISAVGMLLAGLALALFAWAMHTLDSQYTPAHRAHLPERIVQSGPYRYIRHPVYTSNLILLTAMLLVSGSLWMVLNLLILVAYYVPTILIEERAIMAEFPEYRAYAQRTGRFFPRR